MTSCRLSLAFRAISVPVVIAALISGERLRESDREVQDSQAILYQFQQRWHPGIKQMSVSARVITIVSVSSFCCYPWAGKPNLPGFESGYSRAFCKALARLHSLWLFLAFPGFDTAGLLRDLIEVFHVVDAGAIAGYRSKLPDLVHDRTIRAECGRFVASAMISLYLVRHRYSHGFGNPI